MGAFFITLAVIVAGVSRAPQALLVRLAALNAVGDLLWAAASVVWVALTADLSGTGRAMVLVQATVVLGVGEAKLVLSRRATAQGADRVGQPTTAMARTRKVPMPTRAGGRAKKEGAFAEGVEPAEVLDDRDAGASRAVWIGRSPVRVSSMLTESMPTTAAPPSTSGSAASTQEGVAGLAVALGAPVGIPAGAEQDRPPAQVEAVEQRRRRPRSPGRRSRRRARRPPGPGRGR